MPSEGYPVVMAHGLHITMVSLVVEHRLKGTQASAVGTWALEHRLDSWGAWA